MISGSVAKFDFWAKSKNWVSGIQRLTDSQTLEKATLRQNRPESCVEPTRSQNSTVSWRRSASGACRVTAGVRTGTSSGREATSSSTARDDAPSSVGGDPGCARGSPQGEAATDGEEPQTAPGSERVHEAGGSLPSRRGPGCPPRAPAGESAARPARHP